MKQLRLPARRAHHGSVSLDSISEVLQPLIFIRRALVIVEIDDRQADYGDPEEIGGQASKTTSRR
ncbi:MAG TPA: hypothetical protein VK700_01205 [Steroidobacteraceae bacterium]|nr:hypothetical protein [Steroidobacteraceae bacterium]